MSEQAKSTQGDWGDIEAVPEQKRIVPRWFLFCGGGCLILAILLTIGLYYGFEFIKKAANEELQYPRLEQVLPFDHKLDDYRLVGWDSFGSEGFVFIPRNDEQGSVAILMIADTDDEKREFDQLLDPDQLGAVSGMGQRSQAELGKVVVQGRELTVLRALQESSSLPFQKSGEAALAILDLSTPGASDRLLLLYLHQQNKERVGDEELSEFLRPFHVGPDRTSAQPPPEPSPETEDPATPPSTTEGGGP